MAGFRRILVTSALPYANGSIHIGHLVEYIQTDIWVRFQRLRGHECRYMCADDTHGTPVMLSARAQGISPEEMIERMHREHTRDFADFMIDFDNYYTTNSVENREFSELIYLRLKEKGHIFEREVEQAYCPKERIFLPDRLIRGTCPRCGAPDQYGDSCEVCSAAYNPTELKDARCSTCGTRPVTRKSNHFFFRLSDFQEELRRWIEGPHIQEEVRNKLLEWFDQGLKDWDISRDAPYFGFRIPGTEDKYFYVWLDAPVGYLASTKNWADRLGRTFEEFWLAPDSEIVHFIGKDIMYFHTLFWPAMLMGADFRPPTKVFIHGFLTINGQKMSKSRGTFISARQYLDHLDPEYLRYYYACKLTSRVEDIDLNLSDFVARVNADIGNQFVNLGSRAISFLHKRFDGVLGEPDEDGTILLNRIAEAAVEIAQLYEGREFSKAMKRICALAHKANQFVAASAPWEQVKSDPEKARRSLTAAINAFARLNVMLAPVLPRLAGKVEALLGRTGMTWESINDVLTGVKINPFQPLFTKVSSESVSAMLAACQPSAGEKKSVDEYPEVAPLRPEITIDDFSKVDLRVALIREARNVPGANKLLELRVDLGRLGTRTIFAGIRKSYKPETLVGRKVLVVANLAPRKMKFGTSEGMVLAAGEGDVEVFLASIDPGGLPGQRVR